VATDAYVSAVCDGSGGAIAGIEKDAISEWNPTARRCVPKPALCPVLCFASRSVELNKAQGKRSTRRLARPVPTIRTVQTLAKQSAACLRDASRAFGVPWGLDFGKGPGRASEVVGPPSPCTTDSSRQLKSKRKFTEILSTGMEDSNSPP